METSTCPGTGDAWHHPYNLSVLYNHALIDGSRAALGERGQLIKPLYHERIATQYDVKLERRERLL